MEITCDIAGEPLQVQQSTQHTTHNDLKRSVETPRYMHIRIGNEHPDR